LLTFCPPGLEPLSSQFLPPGYRELHFFSSFYSNVLVTFEVRARVIIVYDTVFKTCLLAYISRTRDFIVTFSYYNVPWLGSSPLLSSPSIKVISTDFSVLSSYTYIKYIDHIYPPLLSPFTLLLPKVPSA
jgi:hypothetical protein